MIITLNTYRMDEWDVITEVSSSTVQEGGVQAAHLSAERDGEISAATVVAGEHLLPHSIGTGNGPLYAHQLRIPAAGPFYTFLDYVNLDFDRAKDPDDVERGYVDMALGVSDANYQTAGALALGQVHSHEEGLSVRLGTLPETPLIHMLVRLALANSVLVHLTFPAMAGDTGPGLMPYALDTPRMAVARVAAISTARFEKSRSLRA